jgi:hypothetical protein
MSNAASVSYTGTNCSRKNSGAMIRAHVGVASDSSDAASIQAAFDGSNRDEYF